MFIFVTDNKDLEYLDIEKIKNICPSWRRETARIIQAQIRMILKRAKHYEKLTSEEVRVKMVSYNH